MKKLEFVKDGYDFILVNQDDVIPELQKCGEAYLADLWIKETTTFETYWVCLVTMSPGKIFKDNIHVGSFKLFLERLWDEYYK